MESVRTMVPCVLPGFALGDNFLLAFGGDSLTACCLPSAWSSFAFDHIARQKWGGSAFKRFVLKRVACPTPATFATTQPWLVEPLVNWVRQRVLELTFTSYRIAPFAEGLGDVDAVGQMHEPSRSILERRFAIRAELDAAVLHIYGLTRSEAEHVLDSFPVLRNTRPYRKRAATASSVKSGWSSTCMTRWPKRPPQLRFGAAPWTHPLDGTWA